MVVMTAVNVRLGLKHEEVAPTQRPPLTSVEERTHPDAQPRFPLFSSVTNLSGSQSTYAFGGLLATGGARNTDPELLISPTTLLLSLAASDCNKCNVLQQTMQIVGMSK